MPINAKKGLTRLYQTCMFLMAKMNHFNTRVNTPIANSEHPYRFFEHP